MKLGQVDLFTKRVRAVDYRRSASEFQLSCSVADMLRKGCAPGWQWSHFPAGELRQKATAARLQRMGLKPGWPDYILLGPLSVDVLRPLGPRFLELKRGKGGRLSDEQIAFRNWCFSNFYKWEQAKSLDEAISILRGWGALRGIS